MKVQKTLTPVRYEVKDLIEFIEDEFLTYIGTDTHVYFMNKSADQKMLRPRFRFEQKERRLEDIEYRIKDFEQRIENEPSEEDRQIFREGVEILKLKLELEKDFNIKHQKEFYEKTGDVFGSRPFCEFPLNKKINPLYDDFNALVMYYDDLSNEEIIAKLENAETLEEKRQIVKDNTEITHILLVSGDNARASIMLKGKVDETYATPTNENTQILPVKFADWSNLTLEDCESIKNNDLQQLVQERIDMDKEKLELEAEAKIKGEVYQIFKSRTGKEYIRYVCPSTQRVYYNILKPEFLSESEYYEKGNPMSYIKAWYSITNLFIELTDKEIEKPSIAC